MTVVFGILCFTAGINVGVLMSMWVSNVIEKRIREEGLKNE